ncbi:MAG TPA: glycine cleavage T C-terminal barrel domain-containing protein, partial [Acidiphilium sp.]
TVDDPSAVLIGRETILRNGERIGWLSSGGFGHTVGLSIGFGYVRNPEGVTDEFLNSGSYALEIATETVPCRLHLAPLYDPAMARIKA